MADAVSDVFKKFAREMSLRAMIFFRRPDVAF